MESILNTLIFLVDTANNLLWGQILLYTLLPVAIYYTISVKFINITMLPHAIKSLKSSNKHKGDSLSSFQALATSLASVIGTGNIAGIAIAIYIGGPGTVFWIWVISLFGMATSMVEHTLAQIYKEKAKDGRFVGGPAYYLSRALKKPIIGIIFAVLMIFTFSFALNGVQSNTIANAFNQAWNIDVSTTGIALAVLTALIIVGGIKRIAQVTEKTVPFMAILYIAIALLVMALNYQYIPKMFSIIIQSAFGQNAIYGGAGYTVLTALRIGIQRALFATEAGLGSATNITASAVTKHPAKQGFLGMFGVFVVAFLTCTATAFIVLVSGVYQPGNELMGIALVQESLVVNIGHFGDDVLAFIIFLLAFSSIIGNYAYAENNLLFLTSKKFYANLVKAVTLAFVLLGSVADLKLIWGLGDMFMALLAIINITALLFLTPIALRVIKDYISQLKQGVKQPVFKKEVVPSLLNDEKNVW